MEGAIFAIIWEIIKSFFKKDPAVETEEMLRDQAIHAQKPAKDVNSTIDDIK